MMIAEKRDDMWTVRDTEGGRWWPDEGAAEAIEKADDPAAMAVHLATELPMSGEWRQ